jgi:hypothetical protein
MSATVRGKSPANLSEATRACLYAVVDRFNTDEPFWSAFIPVADLTEIGDDWFRVAFHGRGLRLTVRGSLVHGIGETSPIVPSIVVGATHIGEEPNPLRWHRVDCAVGDDGKFVTSNFRSAIESAISDLE